MSTKREQWTCPRCGLEGDHLKSPDPKRCLHCCRIDAADDMFAALKHARLALTEAFAHPPPHIAMALAEVETAMCHARGED